MDGRYERSTGRGGFAVALALFAILCGVVLLIAGEGGEQTGRERSRDGVKSAIEDLNAAAETLEAKDYGETRGHLLSARRKLLELIE